MNKKPPSVYSNPRSLYFPQFSDSLFIKSPPPLLPPCIWDLRVLITKDE